MIKAHEYCGLRNLDSKTLDTSMTSYLNWFPARIYKEAEWYLRCQSRTIISTIVNSRLAIGTIRRTTFYWAAPVLFTGKKDGDIKRLFDCQQLNAITTDSKYLLSLTIGLVDSLLDTSKFTKPLVDSLLDTNKFTKLNIQNMYGSLQVSKGDRGNKNQLLVVWRVLGTKNNS